MKKHSFIRNLFKKMTIGKLLGISSIVLFFLGLFFAVNKIHGADFMRYIQIDVGLIDVDAGTKGPFVGAKFIIKDEYGNEYGYTSNENGIIEFCVDSDNGRCDLGFEDIGKIFYISEDCDGFDDYFSCNDEVVQVSIESDESGKPYARYFYIDEYGNQGSEVYFSAGDDEYIFLNGYRGMLKYKSIQVDVGQIDVSTDVKGPFANAKFIIKDEYGNEYGYVSDENGTIQFCIDSENDRCDLGYEDIGKIFYINEDCDEFDDFGDTFMCDKSVVKVSIESDEGGEPYARYFYIDDNGYPIQEVYPMPGVDNKYIFNNKIGSEGNCLNIQTKVKSKVGNENFKFDLRDRWGSVIESEYSNENGEVEWSLCDSIDNRYFITQDCESLTHNGLLCDGSIVTVNINGESVEYHYDYYNGNMGDNIPPCFARNDEGEAVWGISYGDMSYYSFPQYSSRQSWEGGDWDNYANNNRGGITTGSYVRDPESIDWAFYNSMMPVHLNLKTKVELDGAEIQSGMFNFKLSHYDSAISIASNNQSGDISFVNLNGDSYGLHEYDSCPYTLEGQDNTGENILGYDINAMLDEYGVQGLLGGDTMTMQSYKISQGSKCSNFGYYICDDKEIQVEPQISCNSMDIGCKVKYSVDGGEYLPSDEVELPSFLNKYHPTGTLDIKGKASGEGYEFLLVDTDTHMQIDSVYSDSEGHFGFEIEYDDEVIIGTHTYYIKSPLLACNTSYECSDTGMVTLTVNITDEGDGNLKIEPRYCIEDIGCSENLEDFIFTAPIEITARVRSKVGNAGFKFDLRNSEGTIIDSGYRSDDNGFLSRKIYDRSNNLYFITQDCDEIVYPGLICDGSIVAVKIDGENIMYHFDTYDNMNQFLFDDNAYHDYDGAVEWGRRYADGRYYSIENSPSWQDWNDYGRNLYTDYVESDTDNWTNEYTRPSNNRALDENSYSFYNKLRPVCVELKSKVELSGATLSSGMFDFRFDNFTSNDFYNDENGDIWFKPLYLGGLESFNSYDFRNKTNGDIELTCFNVEDIADEYIMADIMGHDISVDLGTVTYEISQGNKCEEYGYYECDGLQRQVDVSLSCNKYGCSTEYSIDGINYQYGDVIEIPKFVNEYKTIDLYVAVSNGDDLNGVDSISFDLLKNGTAFPTSYTVSKSSDWKMTITDLPKYDSNGTEIEYSIDLYEIPHYTGTILPVQQGESITFNVTLTGVIYTATFLPGQTVNATLKSLAKGATVSYTVQDNLIQQIVRTGAIDPLVITTGLLSISTSEVPIIAWFDNGILYYYSEADVIYLNQNSSNMFYMIQSGTYIDTSGWDTSNVTNMSSMFLGCRSLIELDVSNWNTSNATNMQSMFMSSSSLTGLAVSSWDTSSVTNMGHMFGYCSSLTSLDVSNFDTSKVTNMQGMFSSCSSLTSLDVSNFDTSKVANMGTMFAECKSLTELDVSSWNTSSVTNMGMMFYFCRNLVLTGLNVRNWDTSNVTSMFQMFTACGSLMGLDVSRWDTSNVTNMEGIFSSCHSLNTLDVSEWDTSSVTNMKSMFSSCSSLTGLDVSNWDTSSVINMSYMFSSCRGLNSLDISEWETNTVTNMENIFSSCNNLKTIYASTGFTINSVVSGDNMFSSTSKLVGGHGTKRSNSYTDKTRAVLDSESESGYLTYDIAVSYMTRSGVELARQVINVGDTTVAPSITGYNVMGYYTNTGLTTPFDFSQELRKYTEVYVDWDGCDTGYLLKSGLCVAPVTATFLPGQTVNLTLKSLATGATVTNTNSADTLIQQIVRTGSMAPGFTTGLLSTSTSEVPIIAWFDSGILYYYSEADVIYLNQDSNRMFFIIKSVTYIDTSGWDTSRVTNMYLMFSACSSLTDIDLSSWDTSNVTNMSIMFSSCSSLTGLDVSKWDTSSVTNMSIMFSNCSSLTELDVSKWDTSRVTNMGSMFSSCGNLTGLDVSSRDTSSVTNMSSMFQNCSSLTELDVSKWDTSSVTNMSYIFSSCSSLTNLDVSNWNTSSVTNMTQMFHYCISLTGLDVSKWDTSSVTNMSSTFSHCSGLTELDISRWDTSKVTNMFSMFMNSSNLTGLDVSNWDTSKVTNMYQMFLGCSSLMELDVSNWNMSSVTNMAGMFYGCSSLTGLDVSSRDTSSVTNMGSMFMNSSSLTGLDVSSRDTSRVTNMSYMFNYCSNLSELDVSEWDTSSVTNMSYMFSSCSSLTELAISRWNTSKVTNMSYMFMNSSSLTDIDLSSWDTSSVTNMSYMFSSCSSLTELDVSNWNTSKVAKMTWMFLGCINLNTIYASTGFVTSGVTDSNYMFGNTSKLIGGHGTKYNSSIVNKTRAVIDSESASGYLTYDIAVSYRTNTGVELARQIIDVGDTTVAPTIIRTGYAVSGWYTDTGLTTLFDFSQALRKYTELYVMWKCDTGYMLSGDGVTCIPLTYEVRHFIKNAGELSYTLSGTEIFTGIAGEQVYFDDLSQTYPSCIVYSRGSLTGDENGPGEIETKTDIAGDGSTVINLFYDRNTYTVDLSRDFGIGMVEGAGTYECGQEVQIRAYPIDGYHFDMWEGNVDD